MPDFTFHTEITYTVTADSEAEAWDVFQLFLTDTAAITAATEVAADDDEQEV